MTYPTCRSCSKDFVKRVRARGIVERLTSLFYIYQFKCQLCGYRFGHLQWGVRYVKVEEDRRDYDRIPVGIPVSIWGENIDARGTVTEISMGGCTLSSDVELAHGNILRLGLHVSRGLVPVMVDAVAVGNVRANDDGVEFLRFEGNDRDVLQIFIRGLLLGRKRRLSVSHQISPAEQAPSWAFPGDVRQPENP